MVLLGYSGARGTLIYEKNLKPKISCQTPFKVLFWSARLLPWRPGLDSRPEHVSPGTSSLKWRWPYLLHKTVFFFFYLRLLLKDGTVPVLATEVSGSTVESPVIPKNVDNLEPMSGTHLEICLQGDFLIQEVMDV